MEHEYVTHRDQIHQDVRYDPLSVALIDTPAMQRLGRIYQLGYTHLVYRGGTHTRLSHVMGAAEVAGNIVDVLQSNYLPHIRLRRPDGAVEPDEFLPGKGRKPEELAARWEVLRYLSFWAGLLHDLGHVPLGHTLEDEFEDLYDKHDAFSSPRIPYLWVEKSVGAGNADIRKVFEREELYPPAFKKINVTPMLAWQTVMLICLYKGKDAQSFEDDLKAKVKVNEAPLELLQAWHASKKAHIFRRYMVDIVGNTICADYLDYLRRDPTNVGLDVLRDDRVVAGFFVGEKASGELRMALTLTDRRGKQRLDICTGVEDLVRQRFRFAEIIYYHKAKVAASAMLAKAFGLIGKPAEVRDSPREIINLKEVSGIVDRAIKAGKLAEGARSFKENSMPTALLDCEVGDETLPYMLLNKAWSDYEDAMVSKDKEKAKQVLRGISLLQMLSRRKLYKVCCAINSERYEELHSGSIKTEVEAHLNSFLSKNRKDPAARSQIEKAMTDAAGLPENAIILYLPPRKSQAKGIETGAFDGGNVVTLGEHPGVIDEVKRLNVQYRNLWRMIVLVHPDYANDALALSRAADVLVKKIWYAEEIDLRDDKVVLALRRAAWFPYIKTTHQRAAEEYKRIAQHPNWENFVAAYDTSVDQFGSDEYVDRALLVDEVLNRKGSIKDIQAVYNDPGTLKLEVDKILAVSDVKSREGKDVARLKAIKQICDEKLTLMSAEAIQDTLL